MRMAFEVLDEHEQGELVRKWVQTNAMSIAIGIAVGLLLIFGYQQWKAREVRTLSEAAVQYAAFTEAVNDKRTDDAAKIAEALRKDYAKTAFATLAAMRQAAVQVEKGDLAAASADLDWASQSAGNEAMKSLIALRQARVSFAKGDADAALSKLDQVAKADFPAQASELRGDALAKLGRSDDAKAAYAEALTHLDEQSPERAYVEMKQASLPVAAEQKKS